ncbi:hypothetical protein [Alloactinosynnema sp. L-07]|nr:hypothetical protein [Alloactinosynnema sp. L-07]
MNDASTTALSTADQARSVQWRFLRRVRLCRLSRNRFRYDATVATSSRVSRQRGDPRTARQHRAAARRDLRPGGRPTRERHLAILSQNTSLKQQIRQLGQNNRQLHEQLQGAQDNNRALDNESPT